MAKPQSFLEWLKVRIYQFELSLSLYMMTPGEKFVLYSIFFLLCSLTFIAVVLYLPHHIAFLVGRAWYYINGDHIDVTEVVKEMSASAVTAMADTAETLVKEL